MPDRRDRERDAARTNDELPPPFPTVGAQHRCSCRGLVDMQLAHPAPFTPAIPAPP